MQSCIFCRIVHGEIPARVVYQDDLAMAFHDVNPQAPIHILIVPRQHLASLHECSPSDASLLGHLLSVARNLAVTEGLQPAGYRIVLNTGAGAGQSVFHLHFHLLGGRPLTWPPG